MNKLITLETFDDEKFVERLGKSVLVKGVFDLTHAGHVQLFRFAKSLGNSLIVAVEADASVRSRKGKSRPILNMNSRVLILSEMSSIDYLLSFDNAQLFATISRIRPAYYCASHFTYLTESEQADLCEIGVQFVTREKPSEFLSTSEVVDKIRRHR